MDNRFKMSALFAATLAIVVDQSTKWWALTALRQMGGHLKLPGPIDLTFTFNQSNAFGLAPVIGHATRWLLMSANLLAAALILYVILRREVRPLARFGLALIMAGAVGNALDRLLVGAVIDFLDASKIGFVWIFNIADASVDVGIALLILSSLLTARQTPAQAPRA